MNNNEHPWSFISGSYQLANKAVGDVLAESDPLPPGFIGVMRDSAIIFTTAGGAVHLRIKHRSGSAYPVSADFSSSATGLNAIMTGSGDTLQIVVVTQNASGVIAVNLHGGLQENTISAKMKELNKNIPVLEVGI